MHILSIETSCDETAAAVVEDGTKILSNIVASSQQLHVKTGGIIPEIAAREQIKCLIPVINQALLDAKISLDPKPYALAPNIDALTITVGPGLIGSLLVGVETAKTLAYLWQKPIVPVNHLIAHLYANWLETRSATNKNTKNHELPEFPAIGLIASGGHTDLLLMKNHGTFRWLGGTRDDAAGEAFDKIARLLGLSYPGGPAIATKAAESEMMSVKAGSASGGNHDSRTKLPRPLMDTEDFDFSFSGLKTAVLREVDKLKQHDQFNDSVVWKLSCEVQEAITDVLVKKTLRATRKYKVSSIILGGGVTANQKLRQKMEAEIRDQKLGISLHIPPSTLCADNAATIASAAYFNYKPESWHKIQANPGLYF
ncbi:MAG: tRNA (adenosine(37)-N6)-threonylcarbamoyltransferase complex transferase subunit TsaD [bacterium]|nr:tRNA (adenosine(37)-N6)-threonylcarbamoyltransferase complex transferase subunit TsaD [bacterium]